MAKDLLILTTGGTFDKRYPEGQWVTEFTFPPGQESAVTEILKRGRIDPDSIACEWLFAEDSTRITDAQRDIIASRCATATQSRIVVTHGTDTMTRRIDPATGQVATTPNTAQTIAARKLVADTINHHLAINGHDARVDHLTLKAQGIQRKAERHLGPARISGMSAGEKAEYVAVRGSSHDETP